MKCLANVSVVLQLFIVCAVAKQSSYRAAVVEYAPKLTAEKPMDQLLGNLLSYLHYIENAAKQGVQIIVFPEDGLTGWGVVFDERVIDELSTEIPLASEKVPPCAAQNSNHNKALVDISCAAKAHGIYVAANFIERENVDGTRIYHNTDVVFDRDGVIIARYRKINLFNEDVFHPGNETVTFKTDFGVTFGVMICFDLMFKMPGLEVLKDAAVTDIVYSVAWFSELPFLQALSIQHGYVSATGVNFLAAGMHDSTTANGGSAIYLAGGKIADAYISSSNSSKMIIADVPIIRQRQPTSAQAYESSEEEKEDTQPKLGSSDGISSFLTYAEDMSNYTFKHLDLSQREVSETVCNEGTKFCCSFNISLRRSSHTKPNYVYKLAVFHGSRLISLKDTIGVRNCALIACANTSTTSCGERRKQPPRGVTSGSMSVKGVFSSEDTYDQPATLKHDLKPATGYVFSTRKIGDKVEVAVRTTSKQTSLLTFGLYGRVFYNDNKPTGVIANAV